MIGQPHFINRYGILVGRTLVDISPDDVAVMLLNPLDEDIQLYPGMRIATCETVESWEKAQCREAHLLVNTLTETDVHSTENT